MSLRRALIATVATLGVFAVHAEAGAQDLVYEPINPSFGGNSFNSAHLLAIANAQNDYDPPPRETTSQSELDRFIRSLQSRLLSSLSTQVANAIFGEDAQDEGTITFGDQTVQFVRTLDGIVLTITDADGTQTVITIPVFTTPDDGEGEGDAETTTAMRSPDPLSFTGLSDVSNTALTGTQPVGSASSLMQSSALARPSVTSPAAQAERSLSLSAQAPIQ